MSEDCVSGLQFFDKFLEEAILLFDLYFLEHDSSDLLPECAYLSLNLLKLLLLDNPLLLIILIINLLHNKFLYFFGLT